jgi:hypothetical protein
VSNTWFCQRKLMSDLHHISLLAMYAARDLQNISNCCLKIFNGLTVLKCSCFSSVFLANNRTAPLYRLWQTTCKISNSIIHSCRSVSKIVVVVWLTLLLRFREVLASNLGPETGHTEFSVAFLTSSRWMLAQWLKLGLDRFLQDSFQFSHSFITP